MATATEYAYYLRGNKIAIVERDFTAVQNGQTISVPSIDLPVGGGVWKSPTATIANGLEIEYSYIPNYWINDTSVTRSITDISNTDGFLTFQSSNVWTIDGSSGRAYIVVRSTGKYNGLYRVTNDATASSLAITSTKYNGEDINDLTGTGYIDIDVLNNEADEIPIEPALQRALVYYVKARLAEDQKDFQTQMYFMKEFRRLTERHETARIHGSRQIMPGANAIR